MTTNANSPDESEQEVDADVQPVPVEDGTRGEGDEDHQIVQLPVEFVDNLPEEILEGLPVEIREEMRRRRGGMVARTSITSTSMSMMLGNMINPITSLLNSQHITDIIGITSREADYADRQSEREYADRKHSRNLGVALAASIIVALTTVVIVLIFQGVLDFLREMAMLVIPALGGIGVGVVIGFRIGVRYANSRNHR